MLRGWPVKLLKMFQGDESATQAINEFRSDAQRFDHLAARHQARDPARSIYERSIFHLVAVQQVRRALELSDWQSTPALKSFLESRFRCLLQSQVVEDGFNTCRRLETKNLNHSATPTAMYAALTRERIVASRHKFEEVSPQPGDKPSGRGASVPKDMFCAQSDKTFPQLAQVTGTKQSPSWHTSSAPNACNQWADLELLQLVRSLEQSEKWQCVEHRWLITLCDAPILLKRNLGEQDSQFDDVWYFVLPHTSDSACLAVVAQERYLADDPSAKYFEPKWEAGPVYITMTDLESWVAVAYEWWSPARQWVEWRDCRFYGPAMFEGIRAVPQGAALPLLELACKHAFWNMSQSQLRRLAGFLGVDGVSSKNSLMEVLLALIMHVMSIGEAAALEHIPSRNSACAASEDICAIEVLGFEEGLDLLTMDEKDAVVAEQKAARTSTESLRQLRQHFQERLAVHNKKKSRRGPARSLKCLTARCRKAPQRNLYLPAAASGETKCREVGADISRPIGGCPPDGPCMANEGPSFSCSGDCGSSI